MAAVSLAILEHIALLLENYLGDESAHRGVGRWAPRHANTREMRLQPHRLAIDL